MNERIKELAFQAGFIGESMYPIFGTSQETALKNFAELIVRECVGVTEEYRGTDWGKAAECIGDRIKDHFDIEE